MAARVLAIGAGLLLGLGMLDRALAEPLNRIIGPREPARAARPPADAAARPATARDPRPAGNNEAVPGSEADPLVTRSHLDRFFRFRPLVLPAGERLSLGPGALVVFRSGRVKLRGPSGRGGLIDLTAGEDVRIDTFLPANHLLLTPDDAGYQLEAQAVTVLLVMGLNAP